MFAHQALVDRVQTAVRWGTVHSWNSEQAISNLALYNRESEPAAATEGYLGLRPESVRVVHRFATPDRPDDELLTVAIINYQSHFFSPWIARVLVSPRPVLVTAPISTK